MSGSKRAMSWERRRFDTAAVVYSSGAEDRPIKTDAALAAKVRAACP